MQDNVVVDRQSVAEIDWHAAELVAKVCGPRTLGLVRVRNMDGLRSWLPTAIDKLAEPHAHHYRVLAEIVGLTGPRFIAGDDIDLDESVQAAA